LDLPAPSRAAIKPPDTKTKALVMPVSKRKASNGASFSTAPCAASKAAVATHPVINKQRAPQRRSNMGVSSAPTK